MATPITHRVSIFEAHWPKHVPYRKRCLLFSIIYYSLLFLFFLLVSVTLFTHAVYITFLLIDALLPATYDLITHFRFG